MNLQALNPRQLGIRWGLALRQQDEEYDAIHAIGEPPTVQELRDPKLFPAFNRAFSESKACAQELDRRMRSADVRYSDLLQ